MIFFNNLTKGRPKSDLGFWVKSQSRLKDKARGNFATQPYMTNTVRSKIDDNAVFQDEFAILNSAKAEFEGGYAYLKRTSVSRECIKKS